MKGFFAYFARRHLLANLVMIVVFALGLGSLFTIQRDTYPTVDFGEVIIQTVYPGASPEDVELKVTNKIEEELDTITGLERYVSYSLENMSFIQVQIDLDEDDQDGIKQDIRDAVNRVTDFPEEVDESPLITELKTSVFPVIEVGLSAPDMDYRDLRDLARRFEKRLEQIPGVTRVDRFGYRAREVKVEVDPDKANQLQIPLRDIIRAIQGRNIRSTGGSFESYTSERNIVTLAQFRDPVEVGDVIIRSTFDGPLIKVRDLAIVEDGFEEEKVISRVNGRSAISFLAYKAENADIIRTVEAIKNLVAEEQELLPEQIEIMYSNDTSRYVRNRFSIVLSNGAIGLALLMITLALFLNIRTAVWVAAGIPFAMLGTIFLLPVFDVYLDSITLTSMILVLGIIVDDAIIISENIYRRFENGEAPLEAAVNGIHGVFQPVLTTVLTTFLAFAPMFFMPGMMGKFVFVIPLTVSLALFISLIEVTVVLPPHLVTGLNAQLRKHKQSRRDSWFETLRGSYRRFMQRVLRYRYLLTALFLFGLGGSFWYAVNHMDFILFPSTGADQVYARVKMPVGTSLEKTSDIVREVEELLLDLSPEEVASFTTRIGIDDLIVQNEVENFAVLSISLTPFNQRDRNADEIIEDLRGKIRAIEGIEDILFEIDAGGPPVGRPITLRIVGSDNGLRKKLADDVMAYLQTIEGVKDLDRDDKEGKEQIEIDLNYDQLARLGLQVADVARNVRIAYDGEVVTTVRYGEDDVDFRIQFNREARRDAGYLGRLSVPNDQGRLIPLSQVATLQPSPGPENFYHYDGERAITLEGDVIKGVVTPIEVSTRVMKRFDLHREYPGMTIVVGGEADETRQSVNDLIVTFLFAVIGIYCLLVLLFNSFLQPLLVVMAIPFGLIGVIVAFALHGVAFGFLAMMGVIGLAGVVVNDSLVLVNHLNRMRDEMPDREVRDIIAEGTADRLRAIIMTSLTTVAGLLPLAYGLGGNDPYMSPMALALGWGIFLATPLTLILVPCMYMIASDAGRILRRKPVE